MPRLIQMEKLQRGSFRGAPILFIEAARNRLTKSAICTFALLLACVFFAAPAIRAQSQAQSSEKAKAEKPSLFTYVAQWGIPREQWGEFESYGKDKLQPALEKLMADGTIVGWGRFSVAVHDETGITHGFWFSARSLGNVLRAEDSLAKVPLPSLTFSMHRDHIFYSSAWGGKPGASGTGISWTSVYPMKPGQAENFIMLLKHDMVPVFEQMVADGIVLTYQISTEVVHTGDPNTVYFNYILANGDALDKFQEAVRAAEAKVPAFALADTSMVDTARHHDIFASVPAFASK
jgi:hypothetical protein